MTDRADWSQGPAGWAPILFLSLLATIGAVGAISSAPVSAAAADIAPIAAERININTASEARLQLLPRIGPKTARRIVEDRLENGPFKDAQDFQRVRGIGPKTADRIAQVADFSINP